MILKKRIILNPCHITWEVFRFLKQQNIEENKTLRATINKQQYEYVIEVIDDGIQGVECFEVVDVKTDKIV